MRLNLHAVCTGADEAATPVHKRHSDVNPEALTTAPHFA
jgi:hypothetical protein